MSTLHWEPVEIADAFQSDTRKWLADRMSQRMPWLLVHADDGVIWGRLETDGTLRLSSDVFDLKTQYPAIAVELQSETLLQARIFGPGGELLIWREDSRFRGRSILDGENEPGNAWQEQHMLWGTTAQQVTDFTLLVEGQQGPQHAVPLPVPARHRAALTVRHYTEPDEWGQAAIAISRLVDLGLFQSQKGS